MRHGFSLVELSIVLVILGLLVGGVLTGQSLIRAAELRSVTTEFSKYQAAVNTFRDKYFTIPGDMTNATSFWGAAHATPGTCLTTAGTGTQTCNGNGDGRIVFGAAASQRSEPFMFWQHLANAGLIEGSYNGFVGSTDAFDAIPGINIPKSKLSNAAWSSWYYDGTDTNRFNISAANVMEFGTDAGGGGPGTPALRPEEAWNLDTKIDDGIPARGKVIVNFWNNNCTNASSNTNYAAAYRLTTTSVECALFVINGF